MNSTKGKRTITYREAVKEAIREALQRDSRVFLMGEDVGHYGGCYAVSKGLLDEFGPERIRDTPLCESGFVGAGIGAALGGMRPIVEVMTVNFCLLALDQIVNTAATLLHMSGGQCNVPLVIRMATGAGKQLAAQHAHSFEGWFAHIPGLRVLAPATVEDARGMLWTALADPDPVLICENNTLYNMEGELAADAGPVDIDTARVFCQGQGYCRQPVYYIDDERPENMKELPLTPSVRQTWKTLVHYPWGTQETVNLRMADLKFLEALLYNYVNQCSERQMKTPELLVARG